ncbi:MAG: 2'-5' RNA ligase family protein [Chloroflexota bacterium]
MTTTYGVSSDLTGNAYDAVMVLWRHLEHRYDLRMAQAAIRPHVTYVVGECRKPRALAKTLDQLALQIEPHEVHIDGVDVFEGRYPVIFLKVVRTAYLEQVHRQLYDAMKEAGLNVRKEYQPEHWVPHVTLAFQDVSPQSIAPILEDLATLSYHVKSRLASVDLVHVTKPRHTYMATWPFRGITVPV